MGDSGFAIWEATRRGNLSVGDWMNAPLSFLVKLRVIDLVYSTLIFMNQKNADWNKLTGTQVELIRWIETWPTD